MMNLEDKMGKMFVALIETYQMLITDSIKQGKSIERVDESLKILIRMYLERIEGLSEYCLENMPLAQEKGVKEWIYDSVVMYKQPVLDHFKKEGN